MQHSEKRRSAPEPEEGSPLFTLAFLAWCCGVYGLVIWGALSGRGPFTCLTTWQVALFGHSSTLLAAIVGTALVFGVPFLLGRVAQGLWPASPAVARFNRLFRRTLRSRGEVVRQAQAAWAAMDETARRRSVTRRRNGALIVAAVLLVSTAAVNLYVSRRANADVGRPLRPVVLGSAALLLPEGATPWVRVFGAHPLMEGAMQRDYSIRGTPYRDYYTPLVPAGWTHGQAITLIEKDETYPDLHRPQDIPDPPGPIEGALSGGGPRPEVAAFFQRQGYAVDDRTFVLARKDLHGVIPGEDPFLGGFIWYMGGMFTLMALFVAGLAERQRHRI